MIDLCVWLATCVAVLALTLIVMRACQRAAWRGAWAVFLGVVAVLDLVGPAAGLVIIFLSVLTLLWSARKWSFRTFAFTATTVSLAAVAVLLTSAWVRTQDYAALYEENAQEFLSERLPPRPNAGVKKKAAGPSAAALDDLQAKIGWGGEQGQMRSRALWNLHHRRLDKFVSNAGFGVRRMISVPNAETLRMPAAADPLPQPGSLDEIAGSDSVLAKTPGGVGENDDLFQMHVGGVADFVNPLGFGYLSEDKQLFGFQPHHFHKLPKAERWRVRTVELVSLQLHDPPAVYRTASLPRMQEIRKVPTRPLDLFESTGLAKLESGDDLFIRAATHGVRMLGAIRSVEQCIQCHGGERGDLLGAFSYCLTAGR